MHKTIIAEGKTTTEAISNGLKELNVSKEMVDIKILEEHEKRSFFSILSPRVVKVELTLKEKTTNNEKSERKQLVKEKDFKISKEDFESGKDRLEKFLNDFASQFEGIEYSVDTSIENNLIKVYIDGDLSRILIGYRGEVLNSLQIILSSIANKENKGRIKVILNISNYREKREKSLEELPVKISTTVYKTGKSVTLESMKAYERKIIHSRLQNNNKVTTYSIGEEPYRKVVISKK